MEGPARHSAEDDDSVKIPQHTALENTNHGRLKFIYRLLKYVLRVGTLVDTSARRCYRAHGHDLRPKL